MAFRKKQQKLIETYDPDIVLIQECEISDKYHSMFENKIWKGDNVNKGIGIFSKKGFILKELQINLDVKYFQICEVNNKLLLINIWAMNDIENSEQRYIGQVSKLVNELIKTNILNRKVIIAGDFNWNKIWDKSSRRLKGSITEVVEKVKLFNIESIYHNEFNQKFGEESIPTFYMYRKRDKLYHTDYVFMSNLIQTVDFKVGKYKEWNDYSDHMPLVIEVE
ncbi:hypothetical protein L21TH_1942 [Caldisalinibacter kiritimatiensis]|uniref:Endonuclease/exonuclease/phosphatase domain-containing protein n=2 Tax=Caldisalinibacter kiritimatiensis TaxID=1304284 RepID=R1CTK3_9FIRM|nr:hypothetical protein L21TH_1942 [Caldisalinibacter kiritimatiensis]